MVTQQSIEDGTAPIPTDIVMMPQQWTDYTLHGKKLPAQGYATYAIKILLPNNAIYGLYLDHMTSAYQIFINGVGVASNGTVSKDLSKMKNEFRHQAIYFTPQNSIALIVVHISNKDYRTAGMWHAPVIGSNKAIVKYFNDLTTRDLFLFGAILIIGLPPSIEKCNFFTEK